VPVSYRQYCPVARASEILAERWSLLIVRNLLFGASTFSAIAGGVPSMSRSMLVKRLRELERAGVIVSERKPNGNGCVYRLTPAGADLASVIDSLGHWAERWVEVLPQHLDPGFALWAWCQVQLDRAQLPARRVVVRFVFPDEQPGNQRYWLLVDHGGAELCQSDPGGDADLQVTANTRAFIDWHRGALTWSEATRDGRITVEGDRTLARSLPRWNTQTPVLDH
jgi:DNA-binding HxlR family transcriptional regulator